MPPELFHPMTVHFPIALLVIAFLEDVRLVQKITGSA